MVHVFGAFVNPHEGFNGLEHTVDAVHVGILSELFEHKLLDVAVEVGLGEGFSILQQYLGIQWAVLHVCAIGFRLPKLLYSILLFEMGNFISMMVFMVWKMIFIFVPTHSCISLS